MPGVVSFSILMLRAGLATLEAQFVSVERVAQYCRLHPERTQGDEYEGGMEAGEGGEGAGKEVGKEVRLEVEMEGRKEMGRR